MRTYVIFSSSEISTIDFTEVLQTSADTCRYSLDNSLCIVSWYSDFGTPLCVESLTTKQAYLTHEEILEITATEAWTSPAEETP
jgi:hypothetical protein